MPPLSDLFLREADQRAERWAALRRDALDSARSLQRMRRLDAGERRRQAAQRRDDRSERRREADAQRHQGRRQQRLLSLLLIGSLALLASGAWAMRWNNLSRADALGRDCRERAAQWREAEGGGDRAAPAADRRAQREAVLGRLRDDTRCAPAAAAPAAGDWWASRARAQLEQVIAAQRADELLLALLDESPAVVDLPCDPWRPCRLAAIHFDECKPAADGEGGGVMRGINTPQLARLAAALATPARVRLLVLGHADPRRASACPSQDENAALVRRRAEAVHAALLAALGRYRPDPGTALAAGERVHVMMLSHLPADGDPATEAPETAQCSGARCAADQRFSAVYWFVEDA